MMLPSFLRGNDMESNFEQLIDMADLTIDAYGIHVRKNMRTMNRKLPYYVMSYLQAGVAVLEIGGERYELDEGSIVLIPRDTLHSHYKIDAESSTFLWWHFNCTLFDKVDILQLLNFPLVSTLKNRTEFEHIFYRFANADRSRNPISRRLLKKASSLELLAFMIDDLAGGNDLQYNAQIPNEFWQIFHIVNSLKKISLEDLGEQFSLNSTYVSNRFKYYFGVSPIEMHNEFLLRYAMNALASTDTPIREIAEQLGYVDISGFTHFFQKRAGISPSAYRKTNKQ